MTQGVKLVGSRDTRKCFPEHLKPATLTESSLRASAVWRRRCSVCRKHELDPAHVDHLIEATEEELELGFMEGPFTTEDGVSNHLFDASC